MREASISQVTSAESPRFEPSAIPSCDIETQSEDSPFAVEVFDLGSVNKHEVTDGEQELASIIGRSCTQLEPQCHDQHTFEAAGSGIQVVAWGAAVICCSAGQINFNKYLISSRIFGFPLHLVLLHTFFNTVFAALLYRIAPSLFPSLSSPESTVHIDRIVVLRRILPVAIAFAGNLVCGNMAYRHASVAFLQFMKESNVVLVYTLSLAVGLEIFRWRSVAILLVIVLAATSCIHGELDFSLAGFCFQSGSQVFSATRIVLQTMLLSASGVKLDPLTYILTVMPLCFAVLLATLLVVSSLRSLGIDMSSNFDFPDWSDVSEAWPLLILNAFMAFFLNISIAFFLKSSSAVAFVLAGIVRDFAVVPFSVLIFHSPISRLQVFSFAVELLGVGLWSLIKKFPGHFDDFGLLGGAWAVIVGTPATKDRSAPATKDGL